MRGCAPRRILLCRSQIGVQRQHGADGQVMRPDGLMTIDVRAWNDFSFLKPRRVGHGMLSWVPAQLANSYRIVPERVPAAPHRDQAHGADELCRSTSDYRRHWPMRL